MEAAISLGFWPERGVVLWLDILYVKVELRGPPSIPSQFEICMLSLKVISRMFVTIFQPEDKYNSYSGQYGMFHFNTKESLAYSFVCWQIQIRFDYGFTNTTWSTPSEPVCKYTFMAGMFRKNVNAVSKYILQG